MFLRFFKGTSPEMFLNNWKTKENIDDKLGIYLTRGLNNVSLQGQWLILPSDGRVSLQDVAGNALRFWRPPCLLKRCTECPKIIGTLVFGVFKEGKRDYTYLLPLFDSKFNLANNGVRHLV